MIREASEDGEYNIDATGAGAVIREASEDGEYNIDATEAGAVIREASAAEKLN